MSTSCPSLPARPPAGAGTVVALAAGALVAGAQSAYDGAGLALIDGAVRPVAALSPGTAPAPATPAALERVGMPELPQAAAPADLAALAKGARAGRDAARRPAEAPDPRTGQPPVAGPGGAADAVRPVRGRITSMAGPRDGAQHYGLDIANRIGTPIVAVADGVVEKSGPASGFGLWVVIRHADGSRSVYGHINRAFVSAGERVSAGDRIAEVGNRGRSTGPHLHLEIRQGSTSGPKLDPLGWLRGRGLELVR